MGDTLTLTRPKLQYEGLRYRMLENVGELSQNSDKN